MSKKQQQKTNKNINSPLLKGIIKRADYTQEQLALAIGVSPSRLNLKINGKSEFTNVEIARIVSVLGPSLQEVGDIFFPNCF